MKRSGLCIKITMRQGTDLHYSISNFFTNSCRTACFRRPSYMNKWHCDSECYWCHYQYCIATTEVLSTAGWWCQSGRYRHNSSWARDIVSCNHDARCDDIEIWMNGNEEFWGNIWCHFCSCVCPGRASRTSSTVHDVRYVEKGKEKGEQCKPESGFYVGHSLEIDIFKIMHALC